MVFLELACQVSRSSERAPSFPANNIPPSLVPARGDGGVLSEQDQHAGLYRAKSQIVWVLRDRHRPDARACRFPFQLPLRVVKLTLFCRRQQYDLPKTMSFHKQKSVDMSVRVSQLTRLLRSADLL